MITHGFVTHIVINPSFDMGVYEVIMLLSLSLKKKKQETTIWYSTLHIVMLFQIRTKYEGNVN